MNISNPEETKNKVYVENLKYIGKIIERSGLIEKDI